MPEGQFSTSGLVTVILIILGVLLLITGVVFVQLAERRIPVQYSKKVVGRKMMGAQNTHIPIKPAMANVMPIIFASSFMTFPAMVIELFVDDIANKTGFWKGVYNLSIATYSSTTVSWPFTIANAIIYLLLIIGFTYFYTYATFKVPRPCRPAKGKAPWPWDKSDRWYAAALPSRSNAGPGHSGCIPGKERRADATWR